MRPNADHAAVVTLFTCFGASLPFLVENLAALVCAAGFPAWAGARHELFIAIWNAIPYLALAAYSRRAVCDWGRCTAEMWKIKHLPLAVGAAVLIGVNLAVHGMYWIDFHSGAGSSTSAIALAIAPILGAILAAVCHAVVSVVSVCRKRALPDVHCAKCGYDLENNATGVCPECGCAIVH